MQGKVYYFKVTDKSTGNIVMSLVPVIQKSTGEAGMYDVMNDKFYTNAGTGKFIVLTKSVTENEISTLEEEFNNNQYFTKKNYLQFDGTQYIDTGIIPKNHTVKTMADFDVSNVVLFSTSREWKYYEIALWNNKYYWGLNDQQLYAGNWQSGSGMHTFVFNDQNSKILVDGVEIGNTTGTTSTTRLTIGSRGDNTSYRMQGKVYTFKIIYKTTGKVVQYMIPAIRNKDSVVGMYDVVNDIFYTNNGTGDFTAGN